MGTLSVNSLAAKLLVNEQNTKRKFWGDFGLIIIDAFSNEKARFQF
jgi:hypothetical protein